MAPHSRAPLSRLASFGACGVERRRRPSADPERRLSPASRPAAYLLTPTYRPGSPAPVASLLVSILVSILATILLAS